MKYHRYAMISDYQKRIMDLNLALTTAYQQPLILVALRAELNVLLEKMNSAEWSRGLYLTTKMEFETDIKELKMKINANRVLINILKGRCSPN